jgi:hypothetical protein
VLSSIAGRETRHFPSRSDIKIKIAALVTATRPVIQCGLGPRESRFESEAPTIFNSGVAKLAKRLSVTQVIIGSNPIPGAMPR